MSEEKKSIWEKEIPLPESLKGKVSPEGWEGALGRVLRVLKDAWGRERLKMLDELGKLEGILVNYAETFMLVYLQAREKGLPDWLALDQAYEVLAQELSQDPNSTD